MAHSGRVGGGTPGLEHKFGKWLTYEEAVHETVAFSVLTLKGSRWGGGDFGTKFGDAIDLERCEAVEFANNEVLKGLNGGQIKVLDVNSEFSEAGELVTTVLAQHVQGGSSVVVKLRVGKNKKPSVDPFAKS